MLCKTLILILICVLAKDCKIAEPDYEKEIDRRMAVISRAVGLLRERVSILDPKVSCSDAAGDKYGLTHIVAFCGREGLMVHIRIEYHPRVDSAIGKLDSKRNDQDSQKWRQLYDLGEEAIERDECGRSWLNLRKGKFYISINGNKGGRTLDEECQGERDEASQELSEFARFFAYILVDLLEDKAI